MTKYIDAKWHYPKMGEYPIKFGKYTQQNYPQIPCLILYHGMYGVRFWNCIEECWDDEDCDDYFCEKEAVEKWLYIDALSDESINPFDTKLFQDGVKEGLRLAKESGGEPTGPELIITPLTTLGEVKSFVAASILNKKTKKIIILEDS